MSDAGTSPPKKRVNKLWSVCSFILVVEMMERLCYYTIYPTFPEYLEATGNAATGYAAMQSGPANALKQSFRMLAYLFPLVGGYLADNVLGRYRTILYFTACYVVGVAMLAVAGLPQLMEIPVGRIIFLIGAFGFTAVGTGAIKPNVVNFGAEQYDDDDPEEAEQQKAYFSYFYLTINVGSIFASVWISGLATSSDSGFFYAYLIAAIAMGLALLAFLAGTTSYSKESKGLAVRKPLVSIIVGHVVDGANTSWCGKLSLAGFIMVPIYLMVSLVGSLIPEGKIPSIGKSEDVPGITVVALVAMIMAVLSSAFIITAHYNNDWIHLPRQPETRAGAITTEEVRGLLRALPTIVCVTIGFNICYGGMDIYQIQACQMDSRTGFPDWLNKFFLLSGTKQFNGVFFNLANNASIIVCIPLFENVVFPCLRSMNRGLPISRKAKFNFGFFFAMAGCVIGMVIESFRKNSDYVPCPVLLDNWVDGSYPDCFCYGDDISSGCSNGQWLLVPACAPDGVPMSELSAWWTFVPFWVTGMGEILVNPVIQEFAFDEVSSNLKSILMGITMVVMGCIPSVISACLSGFIPNDLNKGNLDVIFIMFIVLSGILLAVYHVVAIPDKVRVLGEGSLIDPSTRED